MLGLLVMEFNAMEIFYRFEPLQNSFIYLFNDVHDTKFFLLMVIFVTDITSKENTKMAH